MKKHFADSAILLLAYLTPIAALIITGSIGIRLIANYVSEQLAVSNF